jgi:hypothetical protein
MNTNHIIKSGACSMVLGGNYYNGFFDEKPGKLLKISKAIGSHDERVHLAVVRTIRDWEQYYAIPDESSFKILETHRFYPYLRTLARSEKATFCYGPLEACYVNFAGDKDLFETLDYMGRYYTSRVWTSAKTILEFAHTMLHAISFLHDKKLCHLDIKPENIMVKRVGSSEGGRGGRYEFRLIDFGFCSREPFDDFVANVRGTPGYFPKQFVGIGDQNKHEPGLPAINANDMVPVNGVLPMAADRSLVYKIDTYCFGRVLSSLYYTFVECVLDGADCGCFGIGNEAKNRRLIKKLLALMLDPDVHHRPTIGEIIQRSSPERKTVV